MKYETEINAAYSRLGFTPRGKQVSQINDIIIAFNDDKIKNVVLSAPTGTGKSIIGAVVAEVMHELRHPGINKFASFLLTATNVLAHQYHESFGESESGDFHIIKGASNYACSALSTPEEEQTAESCAMRVFQKSGMTDTIDKHCNMCPYQQARKAKEYARQLITNYSYFFVDRLSAPNPMAPRTVCVFDEAHLLNDLFTEHNAIYFSEKRLAGIIEEISTVLNLGNTEVFRSFKEIRTDMQAGKITEENYRVYVEQLAENYGMIAEQAKTEAAESIRQPAKYLKLVKLEKKYQNYSSKIHDLFDFDYPVVFEYKPKDLKKMQAEHEISIKPIFVGEMFEALDNAEHNLLMSATISEQYAKITMSLPGTTRHIRLPPQFPPENKKVVFFKPQVLNFNTMKDPEVIKKLTKSVVQIVDHHTQLGDRGIILAPSFAVGETIAAGLRKPNYRVFEHTRGTKLADILEEFKIYRAGPAVLITPSGYEGVDLPGDLSRFQVIVKMPFASLGEKRIKVILDRYPQIYALNALMKVTQGAGRSVRSPEDHAVTYVLDMAIQRAWTNGDNEWADEFQTSFSSLLGEDA